MRQLQAQAQSLQKPVVLSRADAAKWLEKSLTELGPNARISLQGETATLSLQAAPAAALARWLSQARDNAQALPTQAQLQHASPPGPNSLDVTWRGSLVLRLP
jgi:general secretion pathway protein M